MTARASALACALALAACGKGDGAPAGERGAAPPRDPLLDVAMPAGAARVEGNQFHVDAAAQAGCAAGGDCAVLADLTAAEGFKVNTEYPFKFVPAAGGAVTPAAAFAPTSVRTGRLVLRFRRPSAEPVRIAGDFKLSVCNADRCLIETAALAVAVP